MIGIDLVNIKVWIKEDNAGLDFDVSINPSFEEKMTEGEKSVIRQVSQELLKQLAVSASRQIGIVGPDIKMTNWKWEGPGENEAVEAVGKKYRHH
jgi:hypothetical protein